MNRYRQSLVALMLAAAVSPAAVAASLDIKLTHLRPSGHVRIELFDSAESWIQHRAPRLSRDFAARDMVQQVRIDDLPPGRYAVRAEQPGAGRGLQMPLSWIAPRRGFSGSAYWQGMPRFDRAAVLLDASAASVRLAVHLFVLPTE